MNMSYVIAIPSYKRHKIIKERTLNMLKNYNINKNKIYVFVANQQEEVLYRKHLDPTTYGHIIIGKKGLKNQRNFINQYFPEGQEIVNMDDDLKELKILKNKEVNYNDSMRINQTKKKTKKNQKITRKKTQSFRQKNFLETLPDLNKFLIKAFQILKKHNLYLWGIYPVNNPYFMTHKITKDLRFIVGTFWGNINRKDKDLILTIDEKEDVERTLQYYIKDQGVVRFNNITVNTTYYKTPGGMQESNKNRKKDSLKSAIYLNKKYPDYTKLYLKKKSGYAEVKLIDQKKKNIKENIKKN